MQSKEKYNATTSYFDQFRTHIHPKPETNAMGKSDRKELVLQFLARSQLALPPAVLYRNLRLRHNASFSEKSLGNYLSELEADGLVKRVDPKALEKRTIRTVGEDERGYYLITEDGTDAAGDTFTFQ